MASTHKVWASSFADPADVAAFRRCKEQGKSDDECFKVGDNGVGVWNDDCSEGSGASCALPPEVMEYYFNATADNKWRDARNKVIWIRLAACPTAPEVKVSIRDRMPHISTLENKGSKYRIDLNPDTVAALGKKPHNFEEQVTWRKNE